MGPQVLIAAIGVMLFLVLISILKKLPVVKFRVFDDPKEIKNDESGIWNTITIQVMKRPGISMALATIFLLVFAYFHQTLLY